MTTKMPPDVASSPLVMQKESVMPSQPGGNPDQGSVVGEGRVDPPEFEDGLAGGPDHLRLRLWPR